MSDKNTIRENILEGYDPETGEVNFIDWLQSAYMGLMAPRQKEAYLEGRDPSIQDYIGDAIFAGLNFTPLNLVGAKALGFATSKAPKVANVLKNIPGKAKSFIEAATIPAAEGAYDFSNYKDGRGDFSNVSADMSLETALNILAPKFLGKVAGKFAYDNPAEINKETIKKAEEVVKNAYKDFIRNKGTVDTYTPEVHKAMQTLSLDDIKKDTDFFEKALLNLKNTNEPIPWTVAYEKGLDISPSAVGDEAVNALDKIGIRDYPDELLTSDKFINPNKRFNKDAIDELAKELDTDPFSIMFEYESPATSAMPYSKFGGMDLVGYPTNLKITARQSPDLINSYIDELAKDPDLARIMYVPYDYNPYSAADLAAHGLRRAFYRSAANDVLNDIEDNDEAD